MNKEQLETRINLIIAKATDDIINKGLYDFNDFQIYIHEKQNELFNDFNNEEIVTNIIVLLHDKQERDYAFNTSDTLEHHAKWLMFRYIIDSVQEKTKFLYWNE